MKIAELFEVKLKSYTEINVKDVVKAAGGEAKIKADYEGKSAEYVYKKLMDVAHKLVMDKLKAYSEVGDVDNTKLMDWIDNRFETDEEEF